jgi:thioredoxin 1
MQAPILDQVAEAVAGTAAVAKINVDDHTAAAAQLGIRSIPTLVVFKDSEEVERFVGVQQKDTLVGALERHAGA